MRLAAAVLGVLFVLIVFAGVSSAWEPHSSLSQSVAKHGLIAYDGVLYRIGGDNGSGLLDEIESCDVGQAQPSWVLSVASLSEPMNWIEASVNSAGEVWVVGTELFSLSDTDIYDAVGGTVTSLSLFCPGPHAFSSGDQLFKFGAPAEESPSDAVKVVEEMSPGNFQCNNTGVYLPESAAGAVVASAADGKIYVMGHVSDGGVPTGRLFIFDPVLWSVVEGPSLPVALTQAALTTSPDGWFLWLVGGSTSTDPADAVDTVYRFSVSDQQWSLLSEALPTPRFRCAAAAIGSSLFVAGGQNQLGTFLADVFVTDFGIIFEDGFESGGLSGWDAHSP